MAGIYIHVPFCKTRCIYCDFYTQAGQEHIQASYVQAVCTELSERRKFFPENTIIDTIYIGGGTPTQLPVSALLRIIDTIFTYYHVSPTAEITTEANPDDLTTSYILQLRETPINRLSLGVQTFSDTGLRFLRRRHTAAAAHTAILMCAAVGFNNLSLDLIYGLPGQNMAQWQKDLDTALSLPITHLSAYSLIYESGTTLMHMKEKGEVTEQSEEENLAMFQTLISATQQRGMEHYEISNFALPAFRSLHNTSYWQGVPYLGIGPGAHGYDGTQRYYNNADLQAYIASAGHLVSTVSGNALVQVETLSLYEHYNDYVLTRLRMSDGLDTQDLLQRFGLMLHDYLLRLAAKHLREGGLSYEAYVLRLTTRGLFISDAIMSDLMYIPS